MAKEQEAKAGVLSSDFSFDNTDEIFNFGSSEPVTPKKNILEQVKDADIDPEDNNDEPADKTADKSKTSKTEKEEVNEDELFSFGDESKETKPEVKPKAEKPADKVGDKDDDTPNDNPEDIDPDGDDDEDEGQVKLFTALASDLKDEGIFTSLELDENTQITKDEFFEKFDEEVEARVDEVFQGFVTELKEDADAAAFIQFKRNGGSTADFFRAYAQAPSNFISEDIDLTKDVNQKSVVQYYLQNVEQYDADEIKDKLEWLEEKGKLETTAEKYHEKLMEAEKKQKENLIKQQAENLKKQREASEKFKLSLQQTIAKTEAVGKFKITSSDKKTLVEDITKPTIKAGDKFVSKFIAKMAEVNKDPQKLLLLAKLVLSDFDTTDLEASVQTSVTRKTKGKLADAKITNKSLGNKPKVTRSLADAFDE